MVISTRLLMVILVLSLSCISRAQDVGQPAVMDDCDKVQSLLTLLYDFKDDVINDNAYRCKSEYLLDDFVSGTVILSGESEGWTVNMNTEDMQEVEAETKYLLLVKQLMKCGFLNSWKGSESIVDEEIYHFNFRQTISSNDRYKSILVAYYKVKNKQAYRVEVTFTN